MTQIVVDTGLREKFPTFEKEFEFRDESGSLLGYFVPPEERDREWYEWARQQFPPERLAELRKQVGGRSLAEIIADHAPK
jgi:hypothetical protein